MKYMVCYNLCCSREIEAETAEEAADIVASEVDPPDYMDEMEVISVIDKAGNEMLY